jgi:hypothetical protein
MAGLRTCRLANTPARFISRSRHDSSVIAEASLSSGFLRCGMIETASLHDFLK